MANALNLQDLPDEVQALIEPHAHEDEETLKKIGDAIVEKREEAKAARKTSGIEDVWKECEEAYLGIDDANRSEFSQAKWIKPTSMDGPITTARFNQGEEVRSTAFVRLTSRYVDAGAAKLGEILLPVDDKPFSFGPTPVPELIKGKEDLTQVVHNGIPLERNARPEEIPQASGTPAIPPSGSPQMPQAAATLGTQPPGVPLTVKDLAEENIQIAEKKAKAAEKRIYDWMVECQYPSEMRKVIFDRARLGVGVLHAPFPKPKKLMSMSKDSGALALQITEVIKPAAEWADPWNCYPDPACGENIQDGDYFIYHDFFSAKKLRNLKKLSEQGYLTNQIDKVIEEGPGKSYVDNPGQTKKHQEKRFPTWYYFGTLKREEFEVLHPKQAKNIAADKKEVYVIVTMVNDTVIRATINPLDSGEFPYHACPWTRRPGHWAGIGPGEQVAMPQKTCNAATRALLNNAGKSAGCQFIIDQGLVEPADGRWVITPDKIWYKKSDAVVDDVRKAFLAVIIPNLTKQLMQVIEYSFRLAEEATSIPLITQGQSGPTTPDTYGAAQLQNNNANQLLRSVGYTHDDFITEPVVRQFYEWLLLDPDVPDEEKGEWQINAHGSIALVERAIQDQALMQMGQMVLNPIYKKSPEKWFDLMAKSKRLDPRDLSYTEEEQRKMDSQQPQQAPQVEAAKIRADAETKIQAAHDQARIAIEMINERMNSTELSAMERQVLEKIKASLASDAMKLNVQKDLSLASHVVDIHKHHTPQVATPAVEPAGRAPNGQAFQA